MHQLWNYVKSTIISHFHTNCKFSPNLMMHTKRKCKCSKIVDPTAIKIIQMCWLIVCCVGVDQTYPREENADGNSALERVGPDQMFIKASILYPCQYLLFCFLFSRCMHWLISRWMSRAMWRLLLISWGHHHHRSHHQMRSLKSTFKHRHHFHCHSHQ